MKFKIFLAALLAGLFFLGNFAEAYDLPKIQTEKISVKKVEQDKKTVFKSDWGEFEIFEQKIKMLLDKNENLPADSPDRVFNDKNIVFVAYYKGYMYFLDRYSIEVKKNSPTERSWKQRIFPAGKNIYSKNLGATVQNFYTDGKKFYNSTKQKNDLTEIADDEDKKFLQECFKVGCYYAFEKPYKKNFVTR